MALLLLGLAALLMVLGTVAFARRKPGYDHARHTLSELGEWGSPIATPVALGLFLPVGMACFAATWHLEGGAAERIAILLGLDYIGSALFPCDPGAPSDGTRRHRIHIALGLIQYGGAVVVLAATLPRLEPHRSLWTLPLATLAFLVALLAFGQTLPSLARIRGLLQRVSEGLLFLAAGLLAWQGL